MRIFLGAVNRLQPNRKVILSWGNLLFVVALAVLVGLAVRACPSEPTDPKPTPRTTPTEAAEESQHIDRFTCEVLLDLAVYANERDYDTQIVETFDLTKTIENENHRECEVYARFSDGQILILVLHATRKPDGIEYGYSTREITN